MTSLETEIRTSQNFEELKEAMIKLAISVDNMDSCENCIQCGCKNYDKE